jgi:hypothetical protein
MVSAENSVECLNGDCGAHSITVLGRSNGQVVSSSTVLVRQGQAGWDGSLDGTYRIIGHGSLSLGALGNVSGLLNALSGLDGHGIGEYGGAAFQRVSGVAGSSGLFFDHPQQTAPQVGGTNDKGKIKVFTNAFNKAVSLLDNEACAKLFGGKDAALKALYGASYSYRDLGVPIYNPDTQTVKVTGAATLSNTNPPSVYLNTNGPFSNTTLLVMTPSGVQSKTVDFKTGMRGAEFGALLLLHELGHLVGIFKADASNAELNRQYTQQVQDACFKKE